MHKRENRTIVKMSHTFMPNVNLYTDKHNRQVLNNKSNETEIDNCNCRNKHTCPVPNSYQTKSIINQVNIDCDIAECKQKY